MSNVFNDFALIVRTIVQDTYPDLDPALVARIAVEPPRDAIRGDLSTNAAMLLAKPLKLKPRDVADELVAGLAGRPEVALAEVAGPGFVNLTLNPDYWTDLLGRILGEGPDFGGECLDPIAVNVEYVSANPTGPMHVGHCRGAVVGDALANILSFAGQKVVREYYVNDAGGQIDVLVSSVEHRLREALGEQVGAVPDGLYPGDYLVPVAAALAEQYGSAFMELPESERRDIIRPAVLEAMMNLIREDLARLNVRHDVFFSEAGLHQGDPNRIDATIAELRKRGLVYEGRLPPPKGERPEGWEDREQLLFRSTDVGDDIDRPLAKSDGERTYFAADVAYFADKFARGFREMVIVLGADHAGYVKRLQAVAKAIAGDGADLTIRLCQLVKLYRDGQPVTMGKRSGNFVTLRDVVEEVGSDAVRFMMLYRKNDAPLDFDFAKVTEQSKDNPVFYVQYAHARCASALRQAGTPSEAIDQADLALLTHDGELTLIRKLAQWPRVVEASARAHEPHRIAFYLYELASTFHGHWARGNGDPSLRFVNDSEPELTAARLALTRATQSVLSGGLALTGASAPDELR